MTKFISVLFFFLYGLAIAQKSPADFGYRHLQFTYRNNLTEVLVASKKGEEQLPKPVLLFCQGSLPVPLLIRQEQYAYSVFPFDRSKLETDFHLVIIGKPGIPLSAEVQTLQPNMSYTDSSGMPPDDYIQNDYLEYYVERNNFIIQKLLKEPWVLKNKVVVAGHSAGATIAAKMAAENKKITHLIFASGNPFGRITTMLSQARTVETDSSVYADEIYNYWLDLNAKEKDQMTANDQTDYSFSIPPFEYLMNLKIPVLVTYGTKDFSSAYNDYLKIWCIQNKKENFSFDARPGLDHNFFKKNPDGSTNYETHYWDDVANHWMQWIQKNN